MSDVKTTFQDDASNWQSFHADPTAPKMVVFYSENCPQCKSMHDEWVNLATDVESHHQNVNVMAVSGGEPHSEVVHLFHIEKFPTVRLYTDSDPNNFKTYEQQYDGSDLKEDKFMQFLKDNNVDLSEHTPQVAKKSEDESLY